MAVTVVTSDILRLNVSSSIASLGICNQRKFSKSITVEELKDKLELITGISPMSMDLEVYSEDNELVCKLLNESALLGSFHIDDNMRLHAINRDNVRKLGEYDDVSKIEKYVMSNENYNRKTDSVRSFLKKRQMGQYNPDEKAKMKDKAEEKARMDQEALNSIKVGSRCQVEIPNNMDRRGTVRYVGFTDFQPNVWVGVEYDEPYGKNNGTVSGKEYFSCQDKYGGFVRPDFVKCGNFPPLLDFDDEM